MRELGLHSVYVCVLMGGGSSFMRMLADLSCSQGKVDKIMWELGLHSVWLGASSFIRKLADLS